MGKKDQYRVLVVGSKPKFTHDRIGSYDVAFFANGAASRSPYFTAKKKICVVSSLVISQKGSQLCELCLKEIKKSEIDNFIFLGKFKIENSLDYVKNLKFVSRRRRTIYCVKFIGLWNYIKYLYFFSKDVPQLLKNLIAIVIRGESRLLVPSTGVFAAIYAYENFKTVVRFSINVSGIGISSDGYDYHRDKFSRGHISSDLIYIKKLIKEGVNFFDMEFHKLL